MCEKTVKVDGTETEMEMGLASPWALYAAEAKALFGPDPEVAVEYDNDEHRLTLRVDDSVKAEALAAIMPSMVDFGSGTLEVRVVPSNSEASVAQLIRRAFAGNPALSEVVEAEVRGGTDTYALFVPAATQVRTDDIRSPWGLSTTTYEQLARDVLGAVPAFVSSARMCGA